MVIRFFDLVISVTVLLLLMPILIVVMVILLFTNRGRVFYQQERVGQSGRLFKILKFDTMVENSEGLPGGVLTQVRDPRVLPIGRFLRRAKINELPQLVNVIMGQMSLVGPRPQVKQHYDLYRPEIKKVIDKMPAGVTGVGSVVFHDEEDIFERSGQVCTHFHDQVIAPYKGELELWFGRHRNVKMYFTCLTATFIVMVSPNDHLAFKIFKRLPEPPPSLRQFLFSDHADSVK